MRQEKLERVPVCRRQLSPIQEWMPSEMIFDILVFIGWIGTFMIIALASWINIRFAFIATARFSHTDRNLFRRQGNKNKSPVSMSWI